MSYFETRPIRKNFKNLKTKTKINILYYVKWSKSGIFRKNGNKNYLLSQDFFFLILVKNLRLNFNTLN